jgi:hypothetical protein
MPIATLPNSNPPMAAPVATPMAMPKAMRVYGSCMQTERGTARKVPLGHVPVVWRAFLFICSVHALCVPSPQSTARRPANRHAPSGWNTRRAAQPQPIDELSAPLEVRERARQWNRLSTAPGWRRGNIRQRLSRRSL